MRRLRQLVFLPASWIYTLFLFIKSDISVFALSTATAMPMGVSPAGTTCMLIWITIHLLQFTLAKQYLPIAIAEDRINKPTRPLPSGRITLRSTTIIRIATIPLCLGVSMAYGSVVTFANTSLALAGLTFLYNELNGSAFWAPRSILNGLAVTAFETGATIIATSNVDGPARTWGTNALGDAISAICISSIVVTLTIFAQDFKDVDGDTKAGRTTIPMILNPTTARSLLLFLSVGLSGWLAQFWLLGKCISVAYLGLAAAIGRRFVI